MTGAENKKLHTKKQCRRQKEKNAKPGFYGNWSYSALYLLFLLFFAFYFFKHPEVLQEAYQEIASSELDTGSCRILLPGEEEQNSYQMRPEQRSAAE